MSFKSSKIHAVIVTYEGEKWIKRCLASLMKAHDEIVIQIVDNGSKDDTVAIARKFTDQIEQLETNLGFGAANNIGIQNCLNQGASHILLLNQDCYVHKNSFSEIWKNLEDLPELSVHAMLQLNGTGDGLDGQWKGNYISENNCPGLSQDLILGRRKEVYPIKFTNAAAWVVPRGVFEIVGGFNPTFFHYAEDVDWVNRCNYHKVLMYLHLGSLVLHDRKQNQDRKVTLIESTIGKQRQALVRLSDPRQESSLSKLMLLALGSQIKAIMMSFLIWRLLVKNHRLSKVKSRRYIAKNFNGAFLNLNKK